MAVTVVQTYKSVHRTIITFTFTADGTGKTELPDKLIRAASFTIDGTFGSGTVTFKASNDDSQYDNLGVNTSADPRNATPAVSTASAGNWAMHFEDLGFRYIEFVVSGSTSPNIVVTLSLNH